MTSIEDIDDELAREVYRLGRKPLAHAELCVKTAIEVNMLVLGARMANPESFPGYHRDLSDSALSRRILGTLMDIGWTPPDFGGNDPEDWPKEEPR